MDIYSSTRDDVERASMASGAARRSPAGMMDDKEKDAGSVSVHHDAPPAGGVYIEKVWLLRVLDVEARGIVPTSPTERTDPEFWKIFFIWLSANCNILSFSAGTFGPLLFELGFRDSALVIAAFNIIGCALPGYFATFGPKLGMRQMVHARYTWGYFLVAIPAILNGATMMGFMILNCILGGETLASVSNGRLSWNVGIIIIAIVSLFVSFCGYRVLNWYERLAWLPILIIFIIALGLGGRHLSDTPAATPATARQVLSFGSTIAGFVISYCPLSSDFTNYMKISTPSWKVFAWSYAGLILPITLVQILGAAFAASISAVPEWSEGYDAYNVGGFLRAILSPAHGFGSFLTVLLSLSVTANVSPTLYSFSLNLQVIFPLLYRLPRPLFSLIAVAILIPISIVGKTRFYLNLVNFLGIIGYWAACFGATILMEHLVMRRGRWEMYDVRMWDRPRELPVGLAPLCASLASCGLIWAVMDQVWWVGPIAKSTGDIGFEVGFVLTAIFYVPFRLAERSIFRR